MVTWENMSVYGLFLRYMSHDPIRCDFRLRFDTVSPRWAHQAAFNLLNTVTSFMNV